MSGAPHVAHLRNGTKMGSVEFLDTMLKDGLMDAFQGYHMGTTAENVAQKWQITREEQDKFAVASQNKAEAAVKGGRFKDEITPVTITEPQGRRGRRHRRVPALRRHARRAWRKLRPAFSKEGTVTAGNASGINDGAAAVVLMSADEAERRGLAPLGADRLLGAGGRRSGDHGHRPDPGLAQGAGEGRLDGRRPRSGRGQRGVRRPGDRGQQGHGLGHRQGERQRRRDRARPPDRRLRRPGAGDAAARDAEARTRRRAWSRCASAAAWASPCASSAAEPRRRRGQRLRRRPAPGSTFREGQRRWHG